jgi:hypothetical protein
MQQKTIDNESKHAKFGKSLMQTSRRLELHRITQENQRLLQRIQEVEPIYNHLDWEEEAKQRAMYVKNMSDFREYVPPQRVETKLLRNKSAVTRKLEPLSTAKARPDRCQSAPRARTPQS